MWCHSVCLQGEKLCAHFALANIPFWGTAELITQVCAMQGAKQCSYFAWADQLPNKAPTSGQQRSAPGTGICGTPRASAATGQSGDGSQPGPTQSAAGAAGSWEHSEGEAKASRLCALHVRESAIPLQGWPSEATSIRGEALHAWPSDCAAWLCPLS